MTDNGRVTVYYGSATGLSDLPDVILAGASDGAHYGAGMDTGDFNNDGVADWPLVHPVGRRLTMSKHGTASSTSTSEMHRGSHPLHGSI